MDEIVERVARSLCSRDASLTPGLREKVWPIYVRDAHEAINAVDPGLLDGTAVVVPVDERALAVQAETKRCAAIARDLAYCMADFGTPNDPCGIAVADAIERGE